VIDLEEDSEFDAPRLAVLDPAAMGAEWSMVSEDEWKAASARRTSAAATRDMVLGFKNEELAYAPGKDEETRLELLKSKAGSTSPMLYLSSICSISSCFSIRSMARMMSLSTGPLCFLLWVLMFITVAEFPGSSSATTGLEASGSTMPGGGP